MKIGTLFQSVLKHNRLKTFCKYNLQVDQQGKLKKQFSYKVKKKRQKITFLTVKGTKFKWISNTFATNLASVSSSGGNKKWKKNH